MTTVIRGCGERLAGGVYLTVPMGPDGKAVENFLIDPPMRVNAAAMGLSPLGVAIIPWKYTDTRTLEEVSTHYVFDIVGKEHYPNVADFVEEVRRFGLSRRIAKNSDFAKLDRNSRIILVHERAHIGNSAAYHNLREGDRRWCPRDIPAHMEENFTEMCTALWWEDIEQSDYAGDPNGMMVYGKSMKYDQPGVQMHLQRLSERSVIRQMPSFRYRGLAKPPLIDPDYQYAAFATFPIPVIEVVRDPAGGTHEEAARRARQAGIEVREVDE